MRRSKARAPTRASPKTRRQRPKPRGGYLHGYTAQERDRLYHQAEFLADAVHDRLPFRRCRNVLEVGCGVGAQTEILLRRFPSLHVTGVDRSADNLERARTHLERCALGKGRFTAHEANAETLPFPVDTFDGAFLCWILEHVADPARTLAEVRRVLRSGSPVVVTEVMNATFFLDPYSPNTLRYWRAFNDTQMEMGGDPFVGAKLGNLLLKNGFADIHTEVKTTHLDNRQPGDRTEFLAYWTELLLSGAQAMAKAGKVPHEVVVGMQQELQRVARDPDAVFWCSFVQARARV
ncbi:MAG TPA: methyltransferase domain-containing protein, partial [Planctomycetota bacterium]|nr:methyltransferase domain-containing protein [Planctomycetota bacterium]